MSRAAPFLIDDLLPPGARLIGVRSVNCRGIPRAASVVAVALTEVSGVWLGNRLRALAAEGRPVAVLVAAEGRAVADAAVAALDRHGLPGLVLALETPADCDWIGRLRALAGRLVPSAGLAAEPAPAAAVARYLAKMRELEDLVDPRDDSGADSAGRGRMLPRARGWHARLHARAVTRFLRRQGRPGRLAGRLATRAAPPREQAEGAVWQSLEADRPVPGLCRHQMAREEAVLDRLIAEERALRVARQAPWRMTSIPCPR